MLKLYFAPKSRALRAAAATALDECRDGLDDALFAQLGTLALRFLADGLTVDQLFPLLAGLADHFIGLLAGLALAFVR